MFFKRKYQRKRESLKINSSKFLPVFLLTFILVTYGFSSSYDSSWNFDWSGIRPQVKDSILALKKYGQISTGVGGNGRKETEQFGRQIWLTKNVTNSEFLKLTDYPNATIKALSYGVLLKKNSKVKYSLLKKSLNDTLSFVYVQSGCVGSRFMLNEYLANFSCKDIPENDYSHLKKGLSENQFIELQKLLRLRKNNEEKYLKMHFKSFK